MNARLVRWAAVPLVVIVVIAGVVAGRVIEAVAVAAVLVAVWRIVRGWITTA